MSIRQRFLWLLCASFGVLGCQRETTNVDIVGAWSVEPRSVASIRNQPLTSGLDLSATLLQFRPDGTFSGNAIPAMFFNLERNALKEVFDGDGKWWLTKKDGSTLLRLVVGHSGSSTADLDIHHTGKDLSLLFSLDPDGDFWVILRKREPH